MVKVVTMAVNALLMSCAQQGRVSVRSRIVMMGIRALRTLVTLQVVNVIRQRSTIFHVTTVLNVPLEILVKRVNAMRTSPSVSVSLMLELTPIK